MNLLRLLLLFFVGLFVRRLFSRSAKSRQKPSGPSSSFDSSAGNKKTDKSVEAMRDITEQEIDDADFEEIP